MRIFSIKEFIDKSLPKKEDFPKALELFEELAVLPFLETVPDTIQEVRGTLNYGSINRTDFNIASDIDYLMAVKSPNIFDVIRDASQEVLERYKIVLQPRVVLVDDIELGIDGLEPGFRQSLELAIMRTEKNRYTRDRIKGENPLDVLPETDQDFKSTLRDAVTLHYMKMTKVMTAYPMNENENRKFLKGIMEKSFHVMRIAIQHFYGTIPIIGTKRFEDNKKTLLDIYSQTFSDKSLVGNITRIMETADKYVALLDERMSGKDFKGSEIHDMSVRYTQILSEMFERRHDAYNFARGNAIIMQRNK